MPIFRCPQRWAAVALSLLLVTALMAASLIHPHAASADENRWSSPAFAQVAKDGFQRTVSGGWGTAEIGGAYTAQNPSVSKVQNGKGVLTLAPGGFARQSLRGVTARDTRVSMVIDIASAPSAGNGVTTSALARGSDSAGYLAKFRHDRHGRLTGSIAKTAAGSERIIVSERVVLANVRPGQAVQIDFEATGSSSVTLRSRAWIRGTSTPSWQLTGSDATQPLGSGHSAILGSVSGSSGANTISVDDLSVLDLGLQSPPPPPPPAPAPPTVGSLPVGEAEYPIPSSARFVTAANGTGGDGTAANPYRSLETAIAKSPSGSTLVLRGGNYHESARVPFSKGLTIQNYPGEAVWLDGSKRVTGWQTLGSRWYVPNWNYDFDSRVSSTKGVDESHRYVDPAYPMAGHPDQVWIDGAAQSQVGSLSQVVAGTFFVDKANKRLIIGSNPSGKRVEASTIQKGLQIHGENTTVRGIGIRRYATTLYMMGAVSTEVRNATFENVVVTQNATIGLHGWNDNHSFNRVTVSENGMLGFGHNKTKNLTLKNSVFTGNNREHFKSAPSSGGVKVVGVRDAIIRDNVSSDNINGAGIWFDHESHNAKVTGNTIVDNGATGLMFEASTTATIADNYIVGNKVGLWIYSSSSAEVWNNTLVENDRSFALWQDARYAEGKRVHSINMHNNVLTYGDNFCPTLLQDLRGIWTGADFDLQSNGNYYYRASTSDPERYYCWADRTKTKSYRALAHFRSETGQEARGRLSDGSPIIDDNWQTVPHVRQQESQVALALPSAIATLIEQPAGTRRLGALSSPLEFDG